MMMLLTTTVKTIHNPAVSTNRDAIYSLISILYTMTLKWRGGSLLDRESNCRISTQQLLRSSLRQL